MSCTICGKDVEYPGSTQHFKKHRRDFADSTGYSEHCDREIIKAWANPDKASKWAVDLVEELKDAGRMPKNSNLTEFDDYFEKDETKCPACGNTGQKESKASCWTCTKDDCDVWYYGKANRGGEE